MAWYDVNWAQAGTFVVALLALLLSIKNYFDQRKERLIREKPKIEVAVRLEHSPDKRDVIHSTIKNNGDITITLRDLGVHIYKKGLKVLSPIAYRRVLGLFLKRATPEYVGMHKFISFGLHEDVNFKPCDLKPTDVYSFDFNVSEFQALMTKEEVDPWKDHVSIYFIDDQNNYYLSKPQPLELILHPIIHFNSYIKNDVWIYREDFAIKDVKNNQSKPAVTPSMEEQVAYNEAGDQAENPAEK